MVTGLPGRCKECGLVKNALERASSSHISAINWWNFSAYVPRPWAPCLEVCSRGLQSRSFVGWFLLFNGAVHWQGPTCTSAVWIVAVTTTVSRARGALCVVVFWLFLLPAGGKLLRCFPVSFCLPFSGRIYGQRFWRRVIGSLGALVELRVTQFLLLLVSALVLVIVFV